MMDTFDKVFYSTLTLLVVGAGCCFFATAPHIWPDGLLVALFSVLGLFVIWRGAARSRKLNDAAERDLFLAAAVHYFRIVDDSEIGLTGVSMHERALMLLAWERYRIQVLDRSPR